MRRSSIPRLSAAHPRVIAMAETPGPRHTSSEARLLEALRRGRWDDGRPVLDVADDALAERVIPHLVTELFAIISMDGQNMRGYPMPRSQTPECDSCGSNDVVHVLRWPDAAFRLCEGCTP